MTKVIKQNIDSIALLKHLDSIPKINFPYNSTTSNGFTTINLSEFKNKKLFDIPYKRIPTIIGGGGINMDETDSTFNLTDKNFIAEWNLIKKTQKFLVIEVKFNYVKLVTMDYNLNVIDAIESGASDPSSNVHFSAERVSIINNDLTIDLVHTYSVQTDEKYNYNTETQEENWFIDKNGFFRKSKQK